MQQFLFAFGCMMVGAITTLIVMRPTETKTKQKKQGRLRAAARIMLSRHYLVATWRGDEECVEAKAPTQAIDHLAQELNKRVARTTGGGGGRGGGLAQLDQLLRDLHAKHEPEVKVKEKVKEEK